MSLERSEIDDAKRVDRLSVRPVYWGDEKKIKAEIEITIAFPPTASCKWVFTSGPEYS